MTHTPGPWRVETYPTDVRPHIVHGHEGNGRTIATVTAREGNEQQNAHLIAAAPDLLAALKQICQRWTFDNDQQHTHTWHDWADCVPAARAAIAKAEGRS